MRNLESFILGGKGTDKDQTLESPLRMVGLITFRRGSVGSVVPALAMLIHEQ